MAGYNLPSYSDPIIHAGHTPGLPCRVGIVRIIDTDKKLPQPAIHASVFTHNPNGTVTLVILGPNDWHYPKDCPNV